MLAAMRSNRISRWNVPGCGRRVAHIGAEMVLQVAADRQIGGDVDAEPRKCSAGPMPDSIKSCGVLKVPAERMTSRAASARTVAPPWTYSMPVARVPCSSTRVVWALTATVRLLRPRRRLEEGIGGRRAAAVADGVLATAETFLLLAVVVWVERIAGRLHRQRSRPRRAGPGSWRIRCRAARCRRARNSRRLARSRSAGNRAATSA